MDVSNCEVPKLPNMVDAGDTVAQWLVAPGAGRGRWAASVTKRFSQHTLLKSKKFMCGDHPSFTKTELNVKEVTPEEKEKPKEKTSLYAKLSPTSSVERTPSEHGTGPRLNPRRRVRSLELVQRADTDITAPANRALVQAALGSFRWPPYLACVWVLVLAAAHALHALLALLERALPALKKVCQYFRKWTEESWAGERELNQRLRPVALAGVTAVLYAAYGTLYAVHAAALWAVEPLGGEDERPDTAKVLSYLDDTPSNTNAANGHAH